MLSTIVFKTIHVKNYRMIFPHQNHAKRLICKLSAETSDSNACVCIWTFVHPTNFLIPIFHSPSPLLEAFITTIPLFYSLQEFFCFQNVVRSWAGASLHCLPANGTLGKLCKSAPHFSTTFLTTPSHWITRELAEMERNTCSAHPTMHLVCSLGRDEMRICSPT